MVRKECKHTYIDRHVALPLDLYASSGSGVSSTS